MAQQHVDTERATIEARYPGRKVIRYHEGITRRATHPGDHGRIRNLIGLDSNGAEDFRFGIWTMKPGEVHLLHHHPHAIEVYYVLSGTAKFTVDQEVFEGTPGTCFYLSPGTKHKIVVDGDNPLAVVCIWATDKRQPSEDGSGSYRSTVWDE